MFGVLLILRTTKHICDPSLSSIFPARPQTTTKSSSEHPKVIWSSGLAPHLLDALLTNPRQPPRQDRTNTTVQLSVNTNHFADLGTGERVAPVVGVQISPEVKVLKQRLECRQSLWKGWVQRLQVGWELS